MALPQMNKQQDEEPNDFIDEVIQQIKKLNLTPPKYGSVTLEFILQAGLIKRLKCRTELSIQT
jgi:hypothetical protein